METGGSNQKLIPKNSFNLEEIVVVARRPELIKINVESNRLSITAGYLCRKWGETTSEVKDVFCPSWACMHCNHSSCV